MERPKIFNKEKLLKEKIQRLEKNLAEVTADRDKFRDVFISNFRCAVDVLGKNQTWNMVFVVKTMAEQMTKFQKFYWGSY